MVPATRDPTPMAPPTSQTVASIMASGKVMDRDETEVAQELAMSLEPVLHKVSSITPS
jgi:hypothetical protein